MLYLRKHFDTSGKSAAPFHHRAIYKTADGAAHRNCDDSALNPFGFGDSALVNGFPVRTASASRLRTVTAIRGISAGARKVLSTQPHAPGPTAALFSCRPFFHPTHATMPVDESGGCADASGARRRELACSL